MDINQSQTKFQQWALVILRVAIGWQLLYEGIVKLLNPNWSSVGYLMDSKGIFAGLFHAMAGNPDVLRVVDFMNVWGLVIVGAALILGLFTRVAIYGGIALLSLYCLSHPALLNVRYAIPSEGSYMWINKNLIEIIALLVVLVFPTWYTIGIDRFIFKNKVEN